MKNHINFICIGLLLLLAAARPWPQINTALGIRPPVDSVALTDVGGDSLLVTTPIQVVLPQGAVDSLVEVATAKAETKAELSAENKKADKEIAVLKKKVAGKQSELVTLKEIDALLEKQNGKGPPESKESELEAYENPPAKQGRSRVNPQ